MARGNAVPVMGIQLRREGDYVIVSAEKQDGTSVDLIKEWHDSAFCHNISEHGIAACFERGGTAR